MIFLMNIFAALVLVLISSVFGMVGYAFGEVPLYFFIAGFIASSIFWQIVHKSRYGHWFDPPIVDADTNPPTLAGDRPRL